MLVHLGLDIVGNPINRKCHNLTLQTNPASVKVKLIFLPDSRNFITIIASEQNLILNRLHTSRCTKLIENKNDIVFMSV